MTGRCPARAQSGEAGRAASGRGLGPAARWPRRPADAPASLPRRVDRGCSVKRYPWLKLIKKSRPEPELEPPLWLGNHSNGEYFHPQTRRERLIREFRAELCADIRTREFRNLVLEAPAPSMSAAS